MIDRADFRSVNLKNVQNDTRKQKKLLQYR